MDVNLQAFVFAPTMSDLIRCSQMLPDQLSRLTSHRQLSSWVLLANDFEYLGLGRLVETEAGQHWLTKAGDILTMDTVTQWAWLDKPQPEAEVDEQQLFDPDGLPSAYAHRLLMTWTVRDPLGWLQLARRLWQSEQDFKLAKASGKWVAHAHTGGHARNEGLLAAMERNSGLWLNSWRSSRFRGHCEFEARASRAEALAEEATA